MKQKSMLDCVDVILAEMVAVGARVFDEWPEESPVSIKFGPCEARFTLREFKDLLKSRERAAALRDARYFKKRSEMML